MYIYNVTINIEQEEEQRWLEWMRSVHIPGVMRTGCFTDNQILKVLGVEDQGGTYSVQYKFREMADIERYMNEFAAGLQKEHKEKFGEKYTAFRTVLQLM